MKLLCLDLEMQTPGGNHPTGKIIQVGYCIGETNNGKILKSNSIYINIHEQLTDFIKDLTHITQEQVDNGTTLFDAYITMMKDHKKYGCFINPLTWGGGDSVYLRKELKREHPVSDDRVYWRLGRRWIDCKTLYVAWRCANNKQLAGGLSKAMTKFNLKFEGKKHNAEDDAINTFRLYCRLLDEMR